MANDKRWRLISYDIRDDKRYRKVHKLLKGVARPVQYSIFRSRMDDRQIERLRWKLASLMDPADSLLIVDLCPGCATRVISRNHVEGWTSEVVRFQIYPPASERSADQGSSDE